MIRAVHLAVAVAGFAVGAGAACVPQFLLLIAALVLVFVVQHSLKVHHGPGVPGLPRNGNRLGETGFLIASCCLNLRSKHEFDVCFVMQPAIKKLKAETKLVKMDEERVCNYGDICSLQHRFGEEEAEMFPADTEGTLIYQPNKQN